MSKKLTRIIAGYEIVGGLIGVQFMIQVALTMWEYITYNNVEVLNIMTTVFILGLGILIVGSSLIGGILLWRESKYGVYLSIFAQGMQLIKLTIGGFSYLCYLGALMIVFVTDWSIRFHIMFIGGNFEMFYSPKVQDTLVGINILPLVIILVLIRHFPKNTQSTTEGSIFIN